MQPLVCFIFNSKYFKVVISSWLMEKASLILQVITDWNCSDSPQKKSSTWQQIAHIGQASNWYKKKLQRGKKQLKQAKKLAAG